MIITNRVVLNEKEHDLSMLIDINIRVVIAICFPRVIGSPADTRRPRDVEIRSQRSDLRRIEDVCQTFVYQRQSDIQFLKSDFFILYCLNYSEIWNVSIEVCI